MARLAWTAVRVAMAYLDVESSRRAFIHTLTRDNGPRALVGYAAEREGWTPIPALGSYAFRLQVPLTTEPRGWALRPTPYIHGGSDAQGRFPRTPE
jgi:hypothetical protein